MNHGDIGRYFRSIAGEDFPYERMMEFRTQFIQQIIAEEGLPLKPGVPECLIHCVRSACHRRW